MATLRAHMEKNYVRGRRKKKFSNVLPTKIVRITQIKLILKENGRVLHAG